jgi:hypothetical protein
VRAAASDELGTSIVTALRARWRRARPAPQAPHSRSRRSSVPLALSPLPISNAQARYSISRYKKVLGGGNPPPPMSITVANEVMAAWRERVDASKKK